MPLPSSPEDTSYLEDSYVVDEEGELEDLETGETFPVSEE